MKNASKSPFSVGCYGRAKSRRAFPYDGFLLSGSIIDYFVTSSLPLLTIPAGVASIFVQPL